MVPRQAVWQFAEELTQLPLLAPPQLLAAPSGQLELWKKAVKTSSCSRSLAQI